MKEPFGAAPIPVVRVPNTNAFRGDPAEDEAAQTARLLAEYEAAIVETGPETVAMIIAEPVQNAGGCLVPPEGYWAGLRALADKYGIALVADEVITGFGRIGEWFAAPRFGATPDVITCAKGITSAYAPMGAVIVSDRIAEPLYEEGRMLLHGITYGGHPVAAALALRNIEIFEREGVLENVRAHEGYLGDRLRELQDRLPIVGDVRGAGYFWALELVRDEEATRFSADERERLLRGFLTGRLLEEGLIARPDDRGDAVLHLAPPLISGEPELDEMVAKTEAVLADASERFFARREARRARLVAGGGRPGRARRRRCAAIDRADVVIVGGGYAGLWTAWQLLRARRERRAARGRRLRARAERPQRRLRRDAVDEPARPGRALRRRARAGRRARVRRRASRTIGDWCEAQGVDAWFRRKGFLLASAAEAQDAVLDQAARDRPRDRARTGDGSPRLDRAAAARARCGSPLFRRAVYAPGDATVHPARLALGLRERVIAARRARVRALARARAARRRRRRRGDRGRQRPRRRRGARGQRGHPRRAPAAPPARGHLLAHRADRAGAGRARASSAGPAASRSPTAARSCTTSAPRTTAGSCSAGAAGRSRSAPASAAASSATPPPSSGPPRTCASSSRSSRAAR